MEGCGIRGFFGPSIRPPGSQEEDCRQQQQQQFKGMLQTRKPLPFSNTSSSSNRTELREIERPQIRKKRRYSRYGTVSGSQIKFESWPLQL